MGALNSHTPVSAGTMAISAEQALATTPALITGRGDVGPLIKVTLIVSPGTGATGVTVFCRFGNGITGPQVSPSWAFSGMTAGQRYSVSAVFQDTTNATDTLSGTQYTVSTQQTGAPTATGTVPTGAISVEV